MKNTLFSAFAVSLIVVSMFILAFRIQSVRASGTIYIRADGSIDPITANITSLDSITYTFTDDNFDQLVIERNNVVVNGNGYSLRGSGVEDSVGVSVRYRSNVTIADTQVEGFWIGIHIDYATACNVTGNDIKSVGKYGILLWHSSENMISENNVTNLAPEVEVVHCGIYLGDSYVGGNNVSANTIVGYNWGGIYIDGATNNVFSANNFASCGMYLGYRPRHNIAENNLVNGRPLVYLEDSSDLVVEEAGQVILVNCANITVRDLNLSDTSVGAELWETHNSSVVGNTMMGNSMSGITLWNCSGNTVFENNVSNGPQYGIFLWYSSSNKLFHNNIVNNLIQGITGPTASYGNLWTDGYPSGGNYWSDYNGIDVKYGPNQDNLGSDGIGDQPYTIGVNNLDTYPLMKPFPWAQHDVGITSLDVSKTVVGQGYDVEIRPMLFNYGESIELVELHIQVDSKVFQYALVLSGRGSTYLVLTLHTNEFAMGNYTILAYVEPVPGETDVTDNTFDRWVFITLAGDVDGDRDVDIFDIVRMARDYGKPPPIPFDLNCDIDGDDDIDIFDLVKAAGNYGKSW